MGTFVDSRGLPCVLAFFFIDTFLWSQGGLPKPIGPTQTLAIIRRTSTNHRSIRPNLEYVVPGELYVVLVS